MSDDFDTPGRDSEPDTTLLASAYLDGEATADERALVETSPDTLDDVRRFRDVRTVLSATAPTPSLSQREQHLASALDVWERTTDVERNHESTPAGGVDAAAGAALSTRRVQKRKRTRRGSSDGFGASQWFLSAAAVLVVVAGGAAVVRGILADEGVESDVALDAATEDAPAGVEDIDAMEAAEVRGDDVGDDGILPEAQIEDEAFVDGQAETGLFSDDESATDDAMAESADADADAAIADPAADDVPADAVQPSPAREEDLTELNGPDDLAIFGSLVIPAIGESPINSTDIDIEPPLDSCEARLDVEEIAGFASYQGTPVTVGVNRADDVVIAYVDDTATGGGCEIVETTRLPDPDAPDQP